MALIQILEIPCKRVLEQSMRFILFIDPRLNAAAFPLMKPPEAEEGDTQIHLHKLLLNELHALITDGDRYSFELDVVLEVYQLHTAN